MLLSARMLENIVSVNNLDQVSQIRFSEGDAPGVYFRIVDLNLDKAEQGFSPSGRRYMPPATTTMSVVLDSINDARKVTRAASQPFPTSDPSVWMVQLTTTDMIRGTVNLKLILTEPSRVLHAYIPAAIYIDAGSALDSSIAWRGGTITNY